MLEYKEFKRIDRLRMLLGDDHEFIDNPLIEFLILTKNSGYKKNIEDFQYGDFYFEFDNKYVETYGRISGYVKYMDYKAEFIESYLKDWDENNILC